jgi:NAD(P)-dependent dehydrogenase (short-subunit alcohol dehydrogenase family)
MVTWVVTGANRGIGLALVREISDRGDPVTGTARVPERADELRSTGVRVEQLDVSDDASVSEFSRRLDGIAVDYLIHNAGIGWAGPSVEELEPADVSRNLDVNTVGAIRVTRALFPNLRAGTRKTVVGISSGLASLEGNNSGGWIAYRISKAARWIHLCRARSGVGADGHGRPAWADASGRRRACAGRADRAVAAI